VKLGSRISSREAILRCARPSATPLRETPSRKMRGPQGRLTSCPSQREKSSTKAIKERWASDVIVDLLHAYELPHAALNRAQLPRAARPIVNYGGNRPTMMLCQHEETACRSRTATPSVRHADGGDPAQPRASCTPTWPSITRTSIARPFHRRRDRSHGRDQAPPAHRLDPYRAEPGRGGAQLHQWTTSRIR